MTIVQFPRGPRTRVSVVRAVEEYVLCEPDDVIASTADGVGFVRVAVPDCEHTDTELADLVARCAIKNGRSVSFDLCASEPTLLLVDAAST